jgi:AcrR family transcriptional regulator
MSEDGQKRPPHRPSRRQEIVNAAIGVFARRGYADASIDDLAREAGVAPTAIYYHFGGKEELFRQALRAAMDGFSREVIRTRPDGVLGDPESLRRVVRAGWDWWRAHPADAQLVSRYSDGAAAKTREIRDEWVARHQARAYDYLPDTERTARRPRRARKQYAVHTLETRLLLAVILISQGASVEGGALSRFAKASVAAAVEDACVRIVTGSYDGSGDPGNPDE